MSSLDERARRSAEAVHEAVADADLRLLEAGIPTGAAGVRPALATRVLAFGGAFALVVMAVGLAVVQMNMFASEGQPVGTEPPAPTVVEPPPVTTSVVEETPTTSPPPTAAPTTAPPETTIVEIADTIPPALEITSPADGESVASHLVTFAGITEPGATVTRGKFEATVDAEGNWSLVLVVSEGITSVTFTATDEAGNESHASVKVSYEAPKEEEPGGEFTAFATFGECLEDPPFDEYYGTAAPEAKITITSKYGSGSTFADAEGNWFKKVTFAGAPKDKPFEVTVKDDLGNKKTFSFVAKSG
ncbi:MAG: hypothetical protein ACE5MI_06075 [Acidimicrobiia bacterium]